MTWVTPAATSPSAGVPPAKFGIAIGSGTNSPSGIMIFFCALAGGTETPASTPSEAMPETSCRRLRRNGIWRERSVSVMCWTSLIYADHNICVSALSFGEHRREVLPFIEISGRKMIGLAFDDRAQGALLIDAQVRRRRRAFRNRRRFQRAVPFQPDRECGFRILAFDSSKRLLPATLDLLLEH